MHSSSMMIIVIVAIVLLLILCRTSQKDSFLRYGGPPYSAACEFQPACLWDTARWIQLSNGMEGVCTLNGLACPSFSQDHDRIRTMGLSPTMVDDRYMTSLQEGREPYDYNPTSYQDNGGDYSERFTNPLRKLPSLSRRGTKSSSRSKENYEDPLEFEEAFDFLTEGFNLYENDRNHISGHLYDESQSGVTRLALGGYPTTTN